ncbi:hypothetical protein [Jatrophihabitans fulvus]
MSPPARRARRAWRLAAAAAALVAAVSSVSAAAPAPTDAGATRGTAAAPRFGVPPLDQRYAQAFEGLADTTGQARKLLTTIRVPRVTVLGYLQFCVQLFTNPPDDPATCPDFHPPRTDFDGFDNPFFPIWLLTSGPLWVQSPKGAPLRYGTFPSLRVRTLAFGSIPVSATVHISQSLRADGIVDPLRMRLLIDSNPVPQGGGTIYANRYWPGLTFGRNQGTNYVNQYFVISGRVQLRLSDVTIDGRPVPVGPSCRTARPGSIRLTSPTGIYLNVAPASSLRGRPGGAQPLSSSDAGSIQGSLGIPAFEGCRNGTEDLDPLFTGLVSGPSNPIDVAFASGFSQCGVDRCGGDYPVRPTASTGASGALRTALAQLPAARRDRVLRQVPAALGGRAR